MLDFLKSQYKNILIVLGYIAVALGVYITLAQSLWNIWWITLLISLAIVIAGLLIGYFYVAGEYKKENNKE